MKPATAAFLIVLGLGSPCGPLAPAFAPAARADDEFDKHLEDLRRQVEDTSAPVERRERLALEMAATLDRVGQASASAEERRKRWTEAIRLLDRFGGRNPRHPRAREFNFQAAVYLWARARSWQQQEELDPSDRRAHDEAIKDLDASLVRLRSILEGMPTGINELLSQNVRFRLAQALADRARFDPERSETRRAPEEEGLKALDRPIDESNLRGVAHLLRAELLGRLGRFDQAREAVKEASKGKSPPP